jgi:putative acyl-CoA dehydrogenase
MASRFDPEEVFNQSPPYADIDLFGTDRALQDAVAANNAGDDTAALAAFGRHWGSAPMFEQARLANENPPKLRAFDAQGRRSDQVEFHPAYHAFMAESVGEGLHASTWRTDGAPTAGSAEVCRAARYYMVAQVENGHMCPITMTRASVAALRTAPQIAAVVLPKILSRRYDPAFRPWSEKSGMTLGMGMTEKQGGTDVRANTTRAEPDGGAYRINGHKWFMSAPMCDAFLVLAQAPGGLACFFMPRFRPDGSVNGLHFQRLKDKLGNRSNASSEVEFEDAYAERIGDEGAGVRTILPMVQFTRLDCAISSAGMMRAGLARALHHTRHRQVFGMPLCDQPMMRAVLADMALEVEGALALVMRLCRSFDLASSQPSEAARARLLTPAVKYWICKTAPALIYEAMECLGGNGYVEEGALARLYREAPVNAIWEGSGNVMALDVLRAFARDGGVAQTTVTELAGDAQGLRGVEEAVEMIAGTLSDRNSETNARAAVERLALLAATAALQTSVPPEIAAAFARARLSGARAATYGAAALDPGDIAVLLRRALPES